TRRETTPPAVRTLERDPNIFTMKESTASLEKCILLILEDPAASEIYTLSLHDALPIFDPRALRAAHAACAADRDAAIPDTHVGEDRKSTRLNSSHVAISYAVFCLKKKPATACT